MRTPPSLGCHLQSELGAVPRGTGPPGPVPSGNSLPAAALPPGSAWGPSPSPDVLHEEQDPGAVLAFCPLKASRSNICAEDVSHFWLSGATVMGYTDKHKD